MRHARFPLRAAPLVFLLASACATQVTSTGSAEAPPDLALPRPARVLVADFAVDPDAVRQDQGIGARLQREVSGGDPLAAQSAIAHDVQVAVADALIEQLARAGLPAGPADAAPRPGDLLVQGQINRIDEGNRTRRLAIGFGAGKSIVTAQAEMLYVMADGRPVLLQTYDGKSDSGRKPGMAAGAGGALGDAGPGLQAVSAATGVAGETRRSPVAREGARFGERLAHNIGVFAQRQGWIAAASVPPWSPL